MTATHELRVNALNAADELLAEHAISVDGPTRELLRALLAIAWVEGWAAAGAEAHTAIREIIEELT